MFSLLARQTSAIWSWWWIIGDSPPDYHSQPWSFSEFLWGRKPIFFFSFYFIVHIPKANENLELNQLSRSRFIIFNKAAPAETSPAYVLSVYMASRASWLNSLPTVYTNGYFFKVLLRAEKIILPYWDILWVISLSLWNLAPTLKCLAICFNCPYRKGPKMKILPVLL